MTIDVRRIGPTWFRALFLITIAIPFLNYNIIALASGPVGSFEFFIAWVLYTLLLYAVMISSVGIRECMAWIAFASVLAVVAVGTAALFFYVASLSGFEFTNAAGAPYTQAEWSRDLLKKSLAMISTIPFAMFCVNSFSAAALTERLGGWSAGWASLAPHVVIALRTVQHMTEVIPELLPVWREEFPAIWQPRHRDDSGKSWPGRVVNQFQWSLEVAWRWAAAILIYALEPLPTYSFMVETHFRELTRTTPDT